MNKGYRTFRVTVTKTVLMHLDGEVIEQGLRDDNPILGKGATVGQVLEHLAFNLVANGLSLPDIDGYANLSAANACVNDEEVEVAISEQTFIRRSRKKKVSR